jgi:hypothetical protein
MNNEIFQPAFDGLLALIRLLVNESKSSVRPSLMLIKKTVPLDSTITETGIVVSRAQTEYLQKEDWFGPTLRFFDKIKTLPEYETFRKKLFLLDNKDHDDQLFRAVNHVIQILLEKKSFDSSELLDYFLKSISYEPVPAWADIDLHGVLVKGVPSVAFSLNERRFTFRQLVVSDFEHETYISGDSRFGLFPPNSILKIEMNTWRSLDLQIEALKMTNMLRLFQVCSVKFGRQSWKTKSPFAMVIGSTLSIEPVYPADHPITLTGEANGKLEKFWKYVEPRLPVELREFSGQKTTPISIAYERYCDSLLTRHPIERKIAFAIMGLEAIYLGENEVQELMYRLQLRVSKILSKLNFNSIETRSCLKEGYKIRNSYVHGGHLPEKEKKKLENRGIAVNGLAYKLLDYLRISILHLIISRQTKEEFLDLLEDSFIERKRDEEFRAMMESENSILRI